jgi:hypothetical protein
VKTGDLLFSELGLECTSLQLLILSGPARYSPFWGFCCAQPRVLCPGGAKLLSFLRISLASRLGKVSGLWYGLLRRPGHQQPAQLRYEELLNSIVMQCLLACVQAGHKGSMHTCKPYAWSSSNTET